MNSNKKGLVIGIIVLAVLIAAFAAVYFLVIDKPMAGEKNITVEIIHADKTEKMVKIHTDAEFLRQALEEKGLVEGEESELGLYITTVDSETADWDRYQQYWGLTQDGEMLMTGVDDTPIEDGDHFEITFTVG